MFFVPAFYFWYRRRKIKARNLQLWTSLSFAQQEEIAVLVDSLQKTPPPQALDKATKTTEDPPTFSAAATLYLLCSDFLCINTPQGVEQIFYDEIALAYWKTSKGFRRKGPLTPNQCPKKKRKRGKVVLITTGAKHCTMNTTNTTKENTEDTPNDVPYGKHQEKKRYTVGPMRNLRPFYRALQEKAPYGHYQYDKELLEDPSCKTTSSLTSKSPEK